MQSPEEILATAVIERAILDIFTQGGAIRMSAMAWIDSDIHVPFSFLYLCEHLELDASVIRSIARKVYDDHAIMKELAPRTKNAFLRRFLAYSDNKPEIVLRALREIK